MKILARALEQTISLPELYNMQIPLGLTGKQLLELVIGFSCSWQQLWGGGTANLRSYLDCEDFAEAFEVILPTGEVSLVLCTALHVVLFSICSDFLFLM